MQNRAKLMLALAAISLLGTSGCAKNDAGGSKQAASTSPALKRGQGDNAIYNETRGGTVKSGSGLRFSHRIEQPVNANSGNQVTISVGHDYPGQNLSLTAYADEGLALTASRTSVPLSAGRDASWTIPFRTAGDGVYYINVIGSVRRPDGGQDSGVFSVRVEVGEQRPKTKTLVDEVILPAEEKIY